MFSHQGQNYNIPISLWLMDSHPYHAPLCFVKPTPDMQIKVCCVIFCSRIKYLSVQVSKHVDHSGKIYLPYLHEWARSALRSTFYSPFSSLNIVQAKFWTSWADPDLHCHIQVLCQSFPMCKRLLTQWAAAGVQQAQGFSGWRSSELLPNPRSILLSTAGPGVKRQHCHLSLFTNTETAMLKGWDWRFDANVQIPMQYAGAGFTPQYTGPTPAYPGQYTQALIAETRNLKPRIHLFVATRLHPPSPVPTLLLTNKQKVVTTHSSQQELFTLSCAPNFSLKPRPSHTGSVLQRVRQFYFVLINERIQFLDNVEYECNSQIVGAYPPP